MTQGQRHLIETSDGQHFDVSLLDANGAETFDRFAAQAIVFFDGHAWHTAPLPTPDCVYRVH